MVTATQRTLAALRSKGYDAAVVEKWIQTGKGGFRRDLWGWCDVLALPEAGATMPAVLLGVQSTTGSNVAAHLQKLQGNASLLRWLRLGHQAEVWGWSKRGPRGKRKVWTVRMVRLHVVGEAAVPYAADVE